MTALDQIRFPSLEEAIISSKTIEEASKKYEKTLKNGGDIYSILYANKLQQFRRMVLVTKLRELEREFQELKEHLRDTCKNSEINVNIKRRKKDFIGVNEKIRLFLRTNRPLDRMQDLLGFRITILSDAKDDETSVGLCYEVMNKIISYFVVERNCLLTEAEPILDSGFKKEENTDVIVPKKSLVMPGFENNIKDYVLNPKANGYQSLHCVFKKSDGLNFEVQVRTMSMDIRAEYGSANHIPYKVKRYEEQSVKIDLHKVNMPGFAILPDNTVVDNIGLVYSVDPFSLL